MGEAPKLLADERRAVVETAVGAAGDRPVIVGATHASVHATRALISSAAAAGAAAALIAPPRLDRAAGRDALLAYFDDVAEGSPLEIVLQDHPVSSGVTLPAELIARLSQEVGRIGSVKLEDPPTPAKITRVLDEAAPGFKVFGGLGGMFLHEELGRGANGTMTGFAFPEVLLEVYGAHARGAHDEAAETFYRYLPLIRFEFQEAIGLAIRKRVYQLRGVIESDCVRAPAVGLDSGTEQELEVLLGRLGLQLAARAAG
jgi:4-hydroxy-tetrahydrodipicolinate synthase